MYAVKKDSVPIASILIEKGAKLNPQNNVDLSSGFSSFIFIQEGENAVMWAALNKRFNMLTLLVENGADLTILNKVKSVF